MNDTPYICNRADECEFGNCRAKYDIRGVTLFGFHTIYKECKHHDWYPGINAGPKDAGDKE